MMQHTREREALTRSINRSRSAPSASDTDMLVNERDRIEHSHGMADSVLETAYAARDEFGRQRQSLLRINQRLMQSASASSHEVPCTNDRSNTWPQYVDWENKH